MNAHGENPEEEALLQALFEQVLGAVFEVANTLGAGFLEKVYERALVRELHLRGLRATPQAPLMIEYKGIKVGDYFADILVDDCLAVELKCADRLAPEHTAQCINYLRAANLKLALLVNFQRPKVEWKRSCWAFEEVAMAAHERS